jgi:hypothetical protein
MRTAKLLPWVLLPAVCGVVAYLAVSPTALRAIAFWEAPPPRIELPDMIDLGSGERGSVVIGRFILRNTGGKELRIGNVRTSCTCSGLELENGDGYTRVEELAVGPRQQVELVIRIAVRGNIGEPAANTIWFSTNDPDQPERRITALISRVTGGIDTVPAHVVFGAVPVGSHARMFVDVLDRKGEKRSIKMVEGSNPDRFDVRLLPTEADAALRQSDTERVLLGRVEVVLNTSKPGPVEGVVYIHLAGANRSADAIPVLGRVVPLVDVFPATLVLPRSTGNGPSYFAKCRCQSAAGGVLSLSVISASPGLSVNVSPDEDDSSRQFVEIACSAKSIEPALLSNRLSVQLEAFLDGKSVGFVEIPVICRKVDAR